MTEDEIVEHLIEIKEQQAKVNANIQNLCKKFDRLPCEKVHDKLDERVARRVRWNVFAFLVTIMATTLGGSFLYTYYTERDFHAHCVNPTAHHERLDTHGASR